ncbi:hypothetical protein EGW08_014359 [Elysia chlorotica]|uniref:Profilin n=1 Tax=Elysia chlorotica TaxID=188477 RepID=A0A3S0ZFT8_ELYCH|nr:hypothetical protein EGW08_014359 [Elysia chlorotica]
MSWDSYVTNMKASGLQICGIFGQDGNVWAKAPELVASQQDVANIVAGIKANAFTDGIHLNGIKYTVIATGPDFATAKCRNAPSEAEKYLLHVALGNTCVVMGGIAGAAERTATKLVEDIRDYLAKSNY